MNGMIITLNTNGEKDVHTFPGNAQNMSFSVGEHMNHIIPE